MEKFVRLMRRIAQEVMDRNMPVRSIDYSEDVIVCCSSCHVGNNNMHFGRHTESISVHGEKGAILVCAADS